MSRSGDGAPSYEADELVGGRSPLLRSRSDGRGTEPPPPHPQPLSPAGRGEKKSCPSPYSHGGLQEPDDAVVDVVAEARQVAGPDVVLVPDVAYAWADAKQAPRVLRRLEPPDPSSVQTP